MIVISVTMIYLIMHRENGHSHFTGDKSCKRINIQIMI